MINKQTIKSAYSFCLTCFQAPFIKNICMYGWMDGCIQAFWHFFDVWDHIILKMGALVSERIIGVSALVIYILLPWYKIKLVTEMYSEWKKIWMLDYTHALKGASCLIFPFTELKGQHFCFRQKQNIRFKTFKMSKSVYNLRSCFAIWVGNGNNLWRETN